MPFGARIANILDDVRWAVGEDRPIEISVKQSDDTTPQTMTGWNLTWELFDRPGGTVILTKSVGSGIAIDSDAGTDDRATVTITKANTLNLDVGTYWHSLRRTDSGLTVELAVGTALLMASSIKT